MLTSALLVPSHDRFVVICQCTDWMNSLDLHNNLFHSVVANKDTSCHVHVQAVLTCTFNWNKYDILLMSIPGN